MAGTGKAAGEGDRTLVRAAALRLCAEEHVEALRRLASDNAGADLVRASRAALARCEPIEAALEHLSNESRRSEDAREWNRARQRLRAASSELWLEVDRRT